MSKDVIPTYRIAERILYLREQKIILDRGLARLYGVTTKALNQAVKRNTHRFPRDFAFLLTTAEKAEVVTVCDHLARLRFSPVLPRVFTEHGAIMAATVLNSPRAVEVSVFVVRAFVKLRHFAASHKEFAAKLAELERRVGGHDAAIRQLVLVRLPRQRARRRVSNIPAATNATSRSAAGEPRESTEHPDDSVGAGASQGGATS